MSKAKTQTLTVIESMEASFLLRVESTYHKGAMTYCSIDAVFNAFSMDVQL